MDGEESPLVAAIKSLIERHGLSEELVADTTSIEGFFIWKRTLGNKMRGLRLFPPDSTQPYGYLFAWYEKDGGELDEGKWLWDFEHTVKAFSRFLIEGEDRRQIGRDNTAYLEQHKRTGFGPGF